MFPLWDCRGGRHVSLIHEPFLLELEERLGTALVPQQVFDAILALLSSSSYTTRFAWDLEDAFPHVSFPADADVFRQAADVGSRIRALQTFESDPDELYMGARVAGRIGGPILNVPPRSRAFTRQGDEGTLALTADGTMRVTRVPVSVWRFAISDYPVLHRWLRARSGHPLNARMHRDILNLVARIDQLLNLFDEADALLVSALHNPLTFNLD